MKYWIVAYNIDGKPGHSSAGFHTTANVLLRGGHPVLWIGRQPVSFQESMVTTLLWYAEIDKHTFQLAIADNYILHEYLQ